MCMGYCLGKGRCVISYKVFLVIWINNREGWMEVEV